MKKYQIIYADPPWRFKNYNDKTAKKWVGKHYPCMTTEDICQLPIQEMADKDCVLFIWATFPRLPDCLEVIKRWGFTYKTLGFNWYKENQDRGFFFGMGYWTRSNTEICLLATRGKPKRASTGVFQIIRYPKLRHSEKPPIIRDKIVELMGNLPRIELFSRHKTKGWDVWGNEVESDIELNLNKYARQLTNLKT